MTPDILYDQMIGMGAARKLVFSYGGNPGVGEPAPLPRRDRARLAAADRARGAQPRRHGQPVRGRAPRGCRSRSCAATSGTDLAPRTRVEPITCPFTGEQLVAVPALRPDVAIVHAQEADREGNVQLWGIPGVQKEAVLAADRALVTVERVVDELEPRPGGVVIPGWVIDAVAEAPGRLAAVLQPRHHRRATTTSTASGTSSAATATSSRRGCRST